MPPSFPSPASLACLRDEASQEAKLRESAGERLDSPPREEESAKMCERTAADVRPATPRPQNAPPTATGKTSGPMISDDTAHLLVVLLRYVVLFAAFLIASSDLHERLKPQEEEEEDERPSFCDTSYDFDGGSSWGQCPNDERCHFGGSSATSAAPLAGFVSLRAEILDRRILLLGFPSRSALMANLRDALLSALCWGITFVLIRKGLNPENRRGGGVSGGGLLGRDSLVRRFGRAAAYGSLGVFHSAFLRGVAKNFLPRDGFSRVLRLAAPEVIAGPIYDAFLVASCWGLCQVLIRRRLDPRMRPNLLQRCWRDVFCGSLSLGVASMMRWTMKLYIPAFPGATKVTFDNFNALASLLGFESGERLLNTFSAAVRMGPCWGATYLLVRRGLNPETRTGFMSRYRNDALYGSLAMFSYVLLKAFLKNWILAHSKASSLESSWLVPMPPDENLGVCSLERRVLFSKVGHSYGINAQ